MNPFTIRLRGIARRIPAFRALQRFLWRHSDYEARFHHALQQAVKPGDTVWDIGANVGYYTSMLSDWVGDQGQVIAFEPVPESVHQIEERMAGRMNVVLDQTALAGEEGIGRFALTSSSTTNHLVSDHGGEASSNEETFEVQMARGDTLAQRYGKIPNVIKLDVEGFEDDVLSGMTQVLGSRDLRCILIEVHFRVLESRKRRDAPLAIEAMLKQHGFRTKWLDASHIQGLRASA